MEKLKIENRVSADTQQGWSTRGRQTEEAVALEVTEKIKWNKWEKCLDN